MTRLLAFSILGMAVTSAVALLAIPSLFAKHIPDHTVATLAGTAAAFLLFAFSAFVWRARLRRERTDPATS
ncbi:hypothetical protein FB566_3281 [Stackebrandtia endophytica]|uniref:Uncharacterized protein n=1 Tax=Stackebrandtia endophytica TaxID=1496996 RepID=A0A543AYR6_9ACTN|nr:hypothetical protein [Stackebrandtia endophytica]TQL77717.1 hypothetical protein FB566_3281 [Stackebrandtia endophytica]